jgi:hypothetical protein
MKKISIFFVLFLALVLPWACSDNNTPAKPSGPSFGSGGATNTATGTQTPLTNTPTPTLAVGANTFTPTPTFSVAAPVYKGEYPAASEPNCFYLDTTNAGGLLGPATASTIVWVAENDGYLGYVEAFDVSNNGAILYHTNINVTGCTLGTTIVVGGPEGIALTPNNAGGSCYVLLDNTTSTTTTLYAGPGLPPPLAPLISPGWGTQKFSSPQGFSTDQNYVYVADTGNGYVEEFDPNSGCPGTLGPIHRWPGYSPNNFKKPTCVNNDSAGNIWVGDAGYGPNYVDAFQSGGTTFISQWSTVPGCVINGIAATITGGVTYIYVSDSGNSMVEEYQQVSATQANLVREWGNPHGVHEFQPFKPSCITLDYLDNYIIVGDQNNATVEVFQ